MRVLNSWNMMSIAHTSYKSSLWLSLVAMNSTDNPNPGYQQPNRVLLDLLQPLQLVLDLHTDLRLLKRAPNDSPYAVALSLTPKPSHYSMFRTKVLISLLEVVLGLLQPIHPVLHLQINLRLTKIVPTDSPY